MSASASSGLAVVVTSETTDVCTVSGLTVTLHDVGSCRLVASQAGNAAYLPDAAVTQSFTVLPVSDEPTHRVYLPEMMQ